MSNPRIRVGLAADHARYLETDLTVWFQGLDAGPVAEQLLGVPERYRFVAELDDADPATYPGIYGVRPLTLSVPDRDGGVRQVPCAGLTWVGVHPDHRRQGVLTAMLRHHFEQVRDEPGTHVSALHASEPAIYGRHGYGLASVGHTITLGRGAKLTAPHLDEAAAAVHTRLTTVSDPGMPKRARECHLRCAADALGAVVGDEDFFTRICLERPEELRDKEPTRVLFAQRDGVDVGLAAFRRTQKWEHGRPVGELEVFTLIGDPAARLALVRRLVDFDLVASVKVRGIDVDDPLLQWIGGPRGAGELVTFDVLWIRLVDLAEALEQRAYAAPCDVVLDIVDDAAPWNAGRWRLAVDSAGQAKVSRSEAPADVRLPVAQLGAAYLGGSNLVTKLRAGMIEELRPGAVLELWRAMRAEVAPGSTMGF